MPLKKLTKAALKVNTENIYKNMNIHKTTPCLDLIFPCTVAKMNTFLIVLLFLINHYKIFFLIFHCNCIF